MRILIVEDEASVAARVERLTKMVLGERVERLSKCSTLAAGLHYINSHTIDVLLLDLNLNGLNGFDLLKTIVSHSFHTIIISANTHQAIEAFEFGVLDFIAKPFTVERLGKAFARYDELSKHNQVSARYLTIRKKGELVVIKTEDILYIKGAGNYSELNMSYTPNLLHDKSLNKLETILPEYFKRIHRSYICNWEQVNKVINHGAGKYEIELKNGAKLPISRAKYKLLVEE